jgi:hypothetical protein
MLLLEERRLEKVLLCPRLAAGAPSPGAAVLVREEVLRGQFLSISLSVSLLFLV